MKSVKLLILIFGLPFALAAQDSAYMDSLRCELQHTKNDTIKMDIYRNMGFYLQNGKVDSALYYHEQQLAIAKKLNLKLYEADAHQQIGYVLVWQGDFPRALKNYNQALKIISEPNSAENPWGYTNFSFSKSPADARLSIIGMIHLELSWLYNNTRINEKKRFHLNEAYKIGLQLNSSKILSLTTRDLGVQFAENNQPDSAILYYKKSISQFKKSPIDVGLGFLFQRISQVYETRHQPDSALSYLRKAINANFASNDLLGMSNTYIDCGKIFLYENKVDSALYYSKKGTELAESIHSYINVANGYIQLSAIYELQKHTTLALNYLKKGKLLNDSLNNAYIDKLIQLQNDGFQEQLRLKKIADDQAAYQNRMKIISLIVVLAIFVIIALLLYRNNRQRRKSNKVLKQTLNDLKATQTQLIHSEKMASLGELTAGIAHEIQNPLNFINNFSEVNTELITELNEEIDKGELEQVRVIAKDIAQNEIKISHHGKRADSIVKGMLHHSRKSTGEKKAIDFNKMADEYLRLSYHGLRAKDKSFNADFKLEADESLGKVEVIPEDFGRVLLNLINNAFYAVSEKAKKNPEGYKPEVIVKTELSPSADGGRGVTIRVKDNGPGIPAEIKDKIFQPFFTTKPTGQGTGLGLSMSYDIITKGHGGEITVESQAGEGTEFIVTLPLSLPNQQS
ncbi:MAG TPA: ATP-binding protein [Bacteroidales bacterium]|nr:ATP-binding protein [Bacteroidales bacterium]HRX98252.1 ATP-binding protein [Bacteroidales bacterium]